MNKKELKNALIRITTMYLDKSDKADQYFQECSDIDCENIKLQKEVDRLRDELRNRPQHMDRRRAVSGLFLAGEVAPSPEMCQPVCASCAGMARLSGEMGFKLTNFGLQNDNDPAGEN